MVHERYISQGVPYEYKSLMHYSAKAHSANGLYTIVPLKQSISVDEIGGAQTATKFDYLHINLLYCEGECITGIVKLINWLNRKYSFLAYI